jgi:putative nucleotidyltransferase with HDIG domain
VSTESDSAIDEFDAVFQADPGFASELLQVANSPEFGLRGRIESIRHALLLLGVDRVSSLASSLAMQFYFRKMPTMKEMEAIWAHSIATATVAEAVASACGMHNNSAGAYTAGLVHDIGRMGLLMSEGQPYSTFSSQEFQNADEYLLTEHALFEGTHAEAGGIMAANWGFPEQICTVIQRHHDPATNPLNGSAALVAFACRLATAMGHGAVRYKEGARPEDIMAELPLEARVGSRLEMTQLRQTIATALKSTGAGAA